MGGERGGGHGRAARRRDQRARRPRIEAATDRERGAGGRDRACPRAAAATPACRERARRGAGDRACGERGRRCAVHTCAATAARAAGAAARDREGRTACDAACRHAGPGAGCTERDTSANELAQYYAAVGRKLSMLDRTHGQPATLELWPRYRRIRIQALLASSDDRRGGASELQAIERAIDAATRGER